MGKTSLSGFPNMWKMSLFGFPNMWKTLIKEVFVWSWGYDTFHNW